MSCDLEYSVVHSYFDGELSVVPAAEFRHHLAHCSDCMDEFAALSSLRGSLKYARLYESAPASLRLKIRWDLQSVAPTPSWSPPVSWSGLAAAVGVFLVVLILWRVIPSVRKEEDYQAEFATEIVDAHLRSLLPGQISNVNSTDPETVRAWFASQVEFASFKVAPSPHLFIATANRFSMSSFGARANRTILRMLAHGRVTSGSTGEKTAWSSALFPRPLLLTWSDSIGS